jgi:hypothetical protein
MEKRNNIKTSQMKKLIKLKSYEVSMFMTHKRADMIASKNSIMFDVTVLMGTSIWSAKNIIYNRLQNITGTRNGALLSGKEKSLLWRTEVLQSVHILQRVQVLQGTSQL